MESKLEFGVKKGRFSTVSPGHSTDSIGCQTSNNTETANQNVVSQGQAERISAKKRLRLLELIEQSLVDSGNLLTAAQQNELCNVLLDLVRNANVELRRLVTARVASLGWVSHDLILFLANDDIDIAYDIILQSPVLLDVDLVGIVQKRSFEHRLAIACRPHIGTEVSDALTDFAEPDVIAKLLQNESAHIRDATLQYIIARSDRPDSYLTPLLERRDLPTKTCRILLGKLAFSLSDRVSARFGCEAESLRSVFTSVAAKIGDQPSVDTLKTIVAALDGRPNIALGLLQAGEPRLFYLLISRMSGLRVDQIETLFADGKLEAIAVLCRYLEFEPGAYFALAQHVIEAREDTGTAMDKRAIIEPYLSICTGKATETLGRWMREGIG